jgi:hypothetical protein
MRHTLCSTLSVIALAASGRLSGQNTVQPPTQELQRAANLFAQSDWSATFDAYAALAAKYPTHALSRFRVGVAQIGLGKFAEAEPNLREGERLGVPAAQAGYRLAEVFAEEKKIDAAIDELLRSANAGGAFGATAVDNDPHFASLKAHPKWHTALDAFDAVVRPCIHDSRFREFDFWLGDWDVRPTGAPPVGAPARNTVTLEDNGCVVMEHWNAPSGSEGQSFNIFDRSIGKWRQTWVDNIGGQHDYWGHLESGKMAFVGDTPAPNGQLGRVPTRLTFFHIGKDSVRQFSEISTDSGKTWVPNYDLMYVRRQTPPKP